MNRKQLDLPIHVTLLAIVSGRTSQSELHLKTRIPIKRIAARQVWV